MNQKIKKKWVDALRSGKYLQGTGFLLDEGRYCCLGVLCDVVDTSKWWYGIYSTYEGHSGALPPFVMGEAGLSGDVEHMLIQVNDEAKYSFNEIADWIETHL